MNILYNIFINFYKLGLSIHSLFNLKTRIILESQIGLLNRIKIATKNCENLVWFHASSLGEFEQGKSVIISYKKKNPNHKILITFYSPSGYETIKNTSISNWVFYLPHDTKSNASFMAKEIKPIKVIFIKYDFWYNYINELHKNKIPIYFVSSIFREDQYFFKFYGIWFAKQLKKVTRFFVQDDISNKLLKSIKIENVSVSGDSRFDTVITNSLEKYENKVIDKFCNHNNVLVAGSVWKKDLFLFHNIYRRLKYKLIIVPHEIKYVKEFLDLEKSILLSDISEENICNYDVIIVNEIGILSILYRYADIAYIGGGFGKGIHNTLEAIIYKNPVIFGPKYKKSKEAKELINKHIAKNINTRKEFYDTIKYFKDINISDEITKYIDCNTGSADKITEKL